MTDTLREEIAASSRLARLQGICSRILWTDYGVPAMNNPQTKTALEELFEYAFMDGIDKALTERSDEAAICALPVEGE